MKRFAINSENTSFRFLHADDTFLKSINLKVSSGECILICGKSGSGKTTFSRLLNGISPNYIEGDLTGHVETLGLIAGEADIEDYVPVIGSVFQNPKTQHFTTNTTYELAFAPENIGESPNQIYKRINEVSEELDIKNLLNRDIFKLSGGQKQQVAMAAANTLRPKVLILDEVTSNLDQKAVEQIKKMIKQKKEQGVTIILTEHRLAWSKGLVDRYVLFENGKLVQDWNSDKFNQLTNHELGQKGLRAMDLSKKHKKLLQKEQKTENFQGAYLLQAENLSIGYDKKTPILSNMTVGLSQNKITGIIGPNGVGKTTLANTLTGLLKPLAGKILWHGQSISPKELVKKGFLVMQDANYQLFSESVSEEVLLNAKYPEQKDPVLEKLNLSGLEERHPMSLSGGQKQRVAIASAILSGKELIIFDEPTSGLDYVNMQHFGQLLNTLKETDAIIAIITHDVELSADWCDEIINLG
ncbi:putative ABC transporter ATP-binding protein [Tetragenococcus halophilus subsp. halophilus]|uniref:ABC transporter ATP-binding protein n=1 Tax=Tetragenococcus halophilus (strain DSM 20338 / JCM 20259 / NCIMB 9735 / NBRC 12172) TaxID=945021 RepID=A0AAN1SH69_TETHN|nr:energy-coupling factor ABC transporter ATP-binding protein [Tetragenococcus halophilus]AOF48647.1 ABC transporter ATP-binding protein [Tetragenococcus halophilus]MCO8286303.1 energy-coupling factor ABC transporter ATP-binding protein [Tetragenococcus halophilus]NWN99375.1 energy-coupling factor ABC transporter ATP-binding protein [Tetragenococcus halophilus]RQD32585.1 ABC transporter ATP-binding protein [Tetragenococcus halophilus subsp. halophilus DSM 20339]WJS81109.1 energy-coupling facto